MKRTWLVVLSSAASLVLVGGACTDDKWVILPVLSPPIATVESNPVARADTVAKTIPKSMVLIVHGSVALPIYPAGTVLVVQTIAWERLEAGMTIIYYVDREAGAAAIAGGIITHQEDGKWHVPNIEGWRATGTGGHGPAGLVGPDDYVGVVVEAYTSRDSYDPRVTLREAPTSVSGTCILRCHVAAP